MAIVNTLLCPYSEVEGLPWACAGFIKGLLSSNCDPWAL